MLIEPTTAAVTKIVRLNKYSSLQARGDLGVDVIAIEIPDDAAGWQQLTEDFIDIQLTATNNQITSYGETLIRVNKPETTNAVGVAKIG
jgi:hypothetical protein